MSRLDAATSRKAVERFRDLTLVGKLAVTMGALIIAVAGVIGATMVTTRASIGRHTRELVDARRVKEMAITSLALLRAQDDITKSMLLDPGRMDSLAVRKVEAYDEASAVLGRMDSLSMSRDLRDLTAKLRRVDEERLRALDSRILELTAEGKTSAATRLYFDEYEPIRAEYEGLVARLGEVAEAHADTNARRVTASNQRALAKVAVGLVIGIVVVSAGLLVVARQIGSRLDETVGVVEGVARGDLTRALVVEAHDEIGRMSGSVNRMVRDLRAMISDIKGTSSRLVVSSAEISTAADETTTAVKALNQAIDQIGAGAQEQASVTSETVTVVTKMASSIEAVVKQASGMALAGNGTLDVARRAGETVRSTIQGMDATRQTVLSAAARVRELGEHSKRIGDINKTVLAIADHCNLLALNASIEAARAGEHGAAFRIVADEIRDLATESLGSSVRIGELLAAVQLGMKEVVEAMRLGTENVDQGAEQARAAEDSLEEILRSLAITNEQLQRIAESAHHVTDDVGRVAALVDSVAAVAQQSAASAEEMAAQSVQVASSVKRIAQISSITTGSGPAAGERTQTAEDTLPVMARELDRLVAGFSV